MTTSNVSLRRLLETERDGVLATLSARHGGSPFASLVQFASSDEGEPLLLLSEMAEHTHNLRADPRASLLVRDSRAPRADPLAGARVTLIGAAELIDGGNPPEPPGEAVSRAVQRYTERYTARHPQARQYLTMADFHVWVLHLREARVVGGFGAMGWLAGDALRRALAE